MFTQQERGPGLRSVRIREWRRCCVTRLRLRLPLSPLLQATRGLGLAQGREAVHEGDAGVDLGGLAVGVS